ncbi:hypothetical protein ACOJR9_11565 [Alteromonas sp. A081]|uniref:hypothetical protein n=1 Tax=Alteromonas sp. A081 TaxID=3410269 RepID=UPI003B9871F2
MSSFKNLLKVVAAPAFVLSLAACSENDAESAGEELDEMVTDAGNALEDGGEKIGDMANDAGNAVEDACEDVKEGVEAEDDDC